MRAVAASFLIVALASPATAVVSITTCGTEIPPGETGVLANDLDCSTFPGSCWACTDDGCAPRPQACMTDADCTEPDDIGCGHQPAVTVRKNATLDLNGHAIDAGPNCIAIRCGDAGKRCTVLSSIGRGDVTGERDCVTLLHKTKLQISNVDIHDCQSGIMSGDISARIEATDVTANGHGWTGIRGANIVATNVTANDNHSTGIDAQGKLTGSNVEVSNNGGFGAVAKKRFELAGFVATGNGFGLPEGSGAGIWGLQGGKMSNASLSGNVYQDAGGPIPMDILSGGPLKLTNSTCGRSGGKGGLLNGWGVCSGD